MTDKIQKIREGIEKLKLNLIYGACSSQVAMETRCKIEAYNEVLAILDTMQDEPVSKQKLSNVQRYVKNWNEPVSEELEKAAEGYAITDEVLPNGKVMINFQVEKAFMAGAKWQKEHLWKPADGDNLPEIDREVIALTQPYPNDEHLKVVFAHRPNNKYAKVWNSDLGEEQVIELEWFGKGEWNIPFVKYWLDAKLPYEIKEK